MIWRYPGPHKNFIVKQLYMHARPIFILQLLFSGLQTLLEINVFRMMYYWTTRWNMGSSVELHNMHFFKYRGLKGYAVERQFSHFFEK